MHKEELDSLFMYHAPSGDQPLRYQVLREAAKHFAAIVLECTPSGADQSAAIRKIREAVMTANAAIALDRHFVHGGNMMGLTTDEGSAKDQAKRYSD